MNEQQKNPSPGADIIAATLNAIVAAPAAPEPAPPVEIKGFTAAMFAVACGHTPIRAMADQGGFTFVFPPEAAETKAKYFAARKTLEKLERLVLQAQGREVRRG